MATPAGLSCLLPIHAPKSFISGRQVDLNALRELNHDIVINCTLYAIPCKFGEQTSETFLHIFCPSFLSNNRGLCVQVVGKRGIEQFGCP